MASQSLLLLGLVVHAQSQFLIHRYTTIGTGPVVRWRVARCLVKPGTLGRRTSFSISEDKLRKGETVFALSEGKACGRGCGRCKERVVSPNVKSSVIKGSLSPSSLSWNIPNRSWTFACILLSKM